MLRWPSTLPARHIWATSLTERAKSRNGRSDAAKLPGNAIMLRRDRLSRREMLGLSTTTLLAAGLWPGALRAEGEGGSTEFRFVVVNDFHYLNERCGK